MLAAGNNGKRKEQRSNPATEAPGPEQIPAVPGKRPPSATGQPARSSGVSKGCSCPGSRVSPPTLACASRPPSRVGTLTRAAGQPAPVTGPSALQTRPRARLRGGVGHSVQDGVPVHGQLPQQGGGAGGGRAHEGSHWGEGPGACGCGAGAAARIPGGGGGTRPRG